MNVKLYTFLICIVGVTPLLAQRMVFSYAEAELRMLQVNDALKVCEAELMIARRERSRARSLWWPHLQANGAFAHLSEPPSALRLLQAYATRPQKN